MVPFERLIKYEEMTADLIGATNSIFQFLGLPIQPQTFQFLKDHCDPEVWKKAKIIPQAWNTFRDPKSTGEKWKKELSYQRVKKIQVCD